MGLRGGAWSLGGEVGRHRTGGRDGAIGEKEGGGRCDRGGFDVIVQAVMLFIYLACFKTVVLRRAL